MLIWLFQYYFLDSYYESAKIRDVQKAASKIVRNYDKDDIQNISRQLAFDNSLCIVVLDEMGNIKLVENNIGSYSYFYDDLENNFGIFLFKLKNEFNSSDEKYITKIHQNEHFKSKEIFFCTGINSADSDKPLYLFIESSVAPIDSTVNIIREQLIYITIILFELAFIVTMYISKRLSRPIVEITKTAKKFGAGDYSVEFKAGGYREIEELSTVLDLSLIHI